MEAHQRRALRVLRLVHELHKPGFQLLRIAPGMSASGCYRRCAITHKANILRSHGAILSDEERLVAHYTSSQANEYFGWTDATDDTVQQLATQFTERFADIVDASRGDDREYAGWCVRMLGYAERELFSVAHADWYEEPDPRFLPLSGGQSDLPMPPPGDAEERRDV